MKKKFMICVFFIKVQYLLLVLLILTGMQAFGQPLKCQMFTNGEFKIIDSITGNSYITRKGGYQAEITEGNKDSTTYTVKWINECSYVLLPTNKTLKRYATLPDSAKLYIEIIKTYKQSYIQKTTANFSDFILISEVIKIR